jgi:hypothetical protein
MELGLVARAVCNTVLSYARGKLPGLHYSFGSGGGAAGGAQELPHITG